MDTFLLVAIVTVATAMAGWFYWQTQKTEQRIAEIAARLAEQNALVGEMVDEVIVASQQLYHEMDRWQAVVDEELLQRSLQVARPQADLPHLDEEEDTPALPAQAEADYSPHLHALKMAAEGTNPVEIARYTSIGLEELRLLLAFQEAINAPASADTL